MADIINPFLMIAGIGMMAVAAIAVAYWKTRSKAPWKFFVFGALVWAAAIAVKLLMDATISGWLQNQVFIAYGIVPLLAFASVYVGVRTGLLESGFSYFFAKKKFSKPKFNDAVAFGVGFGAVEAFILGLGSFLNIFLIWMYPQMLDSIGAVEKDMLLTSLSQSTLIAIPAIMERAAAIFIHAFAGVLALASVKTGRMKYLWGSVAYKAVTDGLVPFLAISSTDIISAFLIEVPVMILGIIGCFGMASMRKAFK